MPGNDPETRYDTLACDCAQQIIMESAREHIIRGYFIHTLITSHFRRILKIMLPPAEI